MAKKESGSSVLRKLFDSNVGREIPLDEINELCHAHGLHHWDRVVRNMIQQEGYDIENCPGKWYKLKSAERKPVVAKRGSISKKLRYLVFERDNYTCQACGRTPAKDGVTLSPDHVVPVEWGGETSLENLQALCRECNEGKQAWVSGEDASVMKEVSKQTNTENRLKVYFEAHPNQEIPVDRLAVVAKTREWTRQVRYLKPHHDMNIQYRPKNKKQNWTSDCYIYITEE